MSFAIYTNKLLKKHKSICTKMEDFQSVELNGLLFHDDRYIKNK